MPHDTTPERSDLVAFFTVLAVFFVVTVTGGVWALYKVNTAAERRAKRSTSAAEEAAKALKQARLQLEGGAMPIGRAMEAIARQGRAASPALAPRAPEFDKGPLEGWAETKGPVTMGGVAVAVAMAEPAPAPAPAPTGGQPEAPAGTESAEAPADGANTDGAGEGAEQGGAPAETP